MHQNSTNDYMLFEYKCILNVHINILKKKKIRFLFLPVWIMVGISVNAWGKVPCKDVWNSFAPHKGDPWNL